MTGSFLNRWICRKTGADPEQPLAALADFQTAGLNRTLFRAREKGRFYRPRLKDAGSIPDLNAFSRMPFTLPEQIAQDSTSFLCVSQDEIRRIVTLETSGTTGRPKRIFFTARDLDETIEFFQAVLSRLVARGETALVLLPGDRPASAGDLLKTALSRLDVDAVIHRIVTDFHRAAGRISDLRPSLVIGMPVQVLGLCDLLAVDPPPGLNISDVILTADHVPGVLKQRIRQALDCRVWEHYGMTETGFGGGIDCPAGRGYHLREPDLFFEVVDPASGRPARPGKWGDVVVTTLSRKGMPLIRYRTGDISRLLPGPCACGSPFRRLDYIRGRRDHQIRLSGGIRFGMPDLDDLFFTLAGVVDFRAILDRDRNGPCLDIRLSSHSPGQVDIPPIRELLRFSPVLNRAVADGLIHFRSVETMPAAPADTFRGKRRIEIPRYPPHVGGFRNTWNQSISEWRKISGRAVSLTAIGTGGR